MVDVFTTEKRSDVMARIRGRGNKRTEIALAALFRKHHVVGWRRHKRIQLFPKGSKSTSVRKTTNSVRPDFVFRSSKVAIFVDGCFWHLCPKHGMLPSTNEEFWQQKLEGNKQRDRRVTRLLRNAGWKVLRIWEHDVRSGDRVLLRVLRVLRAIRN